LVSYGKDYQEFEEKNPNTADVINSVSNIASVLPLGKVGQSALTTTASALDNLPVRKGLKAVDSVVDSTVQ